MLMGPASTRAEQEEFRDRIRRDPRNYIAQPIVSLSRLPCIVDDPEGGFRLAGRHIDLRPFVLCGQDITLSLGGLTRVALREGSEQRDMGALWRRLRNHAEPDRCVVLLDCPIH
jgi:uncharacterized circularly permuted ATP-grasp superfamily protein